MTIMNIAQVRENPNSTINKEELGKPCEQVLYHHQVILEYDSSIYAQSSNIAVVPIYASWLYRPKHIFASRED